jgi:hypothetical protein
VGPYVPTNANIEDHDIVWHKGGGMARDRRKGSEEDAEDGHYRYQRAENPLQFHEAIKRFLADLYPSGRHPE